MSDKVAMEKFESLKKDFITYDNIQAMNEPVDVFLSLISSVCPAADGINALNL